MDRATLEQRINEHKWYYSIELSPGQSTKGMDHANIIPLRMALAATGIEEMRCLDIGTQEAFVPALLSRRNASQITAQDIVNYQEKITLVRDALDIDFEYLGGLPMEGMRTTLKEKDLFPFDVIVFSGVLYHMLDPFTGLLIARSCLREGGIMIVETVTALDGNMVMHFNAGGKYIGDSGSYFVLSSTCFDYMLRLLRLQLIDTLYTQPYVQDGLPISRVCIVCRAVSEPELEQDDNWNPGGRHFNKYIDWNELESNDESVPYTVLNPNCVARPSSDSIDVHQTILSSPPLDINQPEFTSLAIEDEY